MRLVYFINEENVANISTIESTINVWLINADLYSNMFVSKWATTTFRKYIINNIDTLHKINLSTLQKITDKSNYMEAFLKPKEIEQIKKDLENNRDVYYFDPYQNSQSLSNTWRHIMDYFKDAPPTRDIKMSVDQAFNAANKHFEEKNKKASEIVDEAGIDVIKKYSDGSYWAYITSEQELNREGKLMNHCVGSYYNQVKNGHVKILSYRTKDNKPHVTMEIEDDSNEIGQIKGNSNSAIKAKYYDVVKDIIKKEKIKADREVLGYEGIIIDSKGNWIDIRNIPDGTIFNNLDITIGNPEHWEDPLVIDEINNIKCKNRLEISTSVTTAKINRIEANGILFKPKDPSTENKLSLDNCSITCLDLKFRRYSFLNLKENVSIFTQMLEITKCTDVIMSFGNIENVSFNNCENVFLPYIIHSTGKGFLQFENTGSLRTKIKQMPYEINGPMLEVELQDCVIVDNKLPEKVNVKFFGFNWTPNIKLTEEQEKLKWSKTSLNYWYTNNVKWGY